MAKKTCPKIIAKLSPKYSWEFLRRNENYIKFYNKFLLYKKSPNYSKDFEEEIFYIGWGLAGAANPNKTYEENIKFLKKDIFSPIPVLLTVDTTKPVHILEGSFTIALSFPKRTIMWSFEKQLNYHLQQYKKFLKKQREKINKSRVRIENYNRYLEVFDLKNKGWGFDRLAKKFYASDVDRGGLSFAKMKVKRDYNRCNELIKYGHQQIR